MGGFDLGKTEILHRLLAQPAEARDERWLHEFEQAAPDASMAAGEPQVQAGPDGFPYFQLHLPPVGEAFSTFSVNHVLPVCTEQGFGCLVGGVDGAPPWVLTYGNLWSLRVSGEFGRHNPSRRNPEGRLLTATPSDELMPDWARKVLRSWLEFMGVADVGVLLAVDGSQGEPVDWLAFSIFPDMFADAARYNDVMNRLHWFLPPRYAVLGVQRGVFEFAPL